MSLQLLMVSQVFSCLEKLKGISNHYLQFNTIVEIIFTSPATVAVLIAVFLDCTIRPSRTDSGIFDNGRHWWERFRDFDKHPMSREFYYLPSGLTKYFPSV
ncbi:hypothetical protein RHGRI_032540 [Rhododendron griersonianum]|uniref:Uncharacterized protein n=1 Tax=Rhododendron griersonianum TaxID=479676 RepID=A0AAV6II02_9ERIC|nr:hypothetical protein RHGRI_032540 [Rhododendron griersonianum]